jgi:hypothetical protein
LRRSPKRVRGFEQYRIPERGQPPLPAGAADPDHLLVGVVEQANQLGPGERSLTGVRFGIGHVHRGVPLVHNLDRVGAETLLALTRPAVGRVDQELAEATHRLLVMAQC